MTFTAKKGKISWKTVGNAKKPGLTFRLKHELAILYVLLQSKFA